MAALALPRPPATPFGAVADQGWASSSRSDSEGDGSSLHGSQGAPSRWPSGALGRASSIGRTAGDGSGTMKRASSLITSGGTGGPPQLWRASTAVTERAASLGLRSVADLCGSAYVPPARLRKAKPLGEGAFAVVETAQLVPPDSGVWPEGGSQPRTVAVKRLKPEILESEDDVVSFIQEARLLISLRHPSIIEFIGLGAADTSLAEAEWRTMYLVQELASGGTLKKLIFTQMINPTRKLYSLQDAVRWGTQVAEGLAYLHGHSPMILHRDLKAENVLLQKEAGGETVAKLADFGLHKLVKPPGKSSLHTIASVVEEEAAEQPNSPTLSAEQQAMYEMTGRTGAYVYMAPEVLLGKKYNERVDVFSFGMVLYELVHRKMVVAELMYLGSAEDAEAFAYKVAAGYRMPIAPEVPAPLAKLISECLSGAPELRPSMAQVVERLKEVAASGELEALEHRHGPKGAQAGCCTIM